MAEQERFFMMKNVRVSFPHLFKRPVIDGEEGNFGATLLLDDNDHADVITSIENHITDMSKAKFKRVLPADKMCLRVGTDKRAEYEGYYALSANNQKKPLVINTKGDGVVNDEDDCKIYAGCRVNAKVSFWAQNNSYGKRVNCQLVAIQFAGDDEAFDGSYVPVDEAMEGFDATGTEGGGSFLD